MRGSLPSVHSRTTSSGIIPAHAGLTPARITDESEKWDHPRACGAHGTPVSKNEADLGSSPRMRGSPAFSGGKYFCRGIIPAHAGLTATGQQLPLSIGDHPRACGAHLDWLCQHDQSRGSSPRMRGSQKDKAHINSMWGIIPAHAGLTMRPHRLRQPRRDHPRACGAHTKKSQY